MSALIYCNLFIDNDWDERKIIDQIFTVKIDSSENILKSYTHLGVYFGGQRDTALVETPMDQDFHSYLEAHFGKLAQAKLSLNSKEIKESELVLVGVSKKEEKIFGEKLLSEKRQMNSQRFISLNRKDFLFILAKKLKITFPKSELVFFKDLVEDDSYMIKFLSSAGGRGVFKITPDNHMLRFLERQLEDEAQDLQVLKQELIEIKNHYYTVAHTDAEWAPAGFQIEYDEKGNSKKHTFEAILPKERSDLALQIAKELKEQGYHGSFGFDGFCSYDGRNFPAVDLNVRFDKSSLFNMILKRLDLTGKISTFYRERFSTRSWKSFKDFHDKQLSRLKQNGRFQMTVILCSNLFHESEQEVMAELTLLVTREIKSSDDEFNQWLSESYALLGIN